MVENNKVPDLTNNNFDEFIKQGFVLVDFFADWCMPCVMMSPILDELSEKFEGKIKFGKVDISGNQKLAQKFEIKSIPNLILFKDGKVVEQFIGSMPSEELEGKLRGFLGQ